MSGCRVRFSGRRPLAGTPREALQRLLETVLREHGKSGCVSIAFVGDEEIRDLNRRFLGKDRATDVIAFPLEEAGRDGEVSDAVGPWGEVVVSVDTARREAGRRGLPVEREVALYALHGVLHLVGFDDLSPEEKRRMRRAEKKYLEGFLD